jgi:hypothetical protein
VTGDAQVRPVSEVVQHTRADEVAMSRWAVLAGILAAGVSGTGAGAQGRPPWGPPAGARAVTVDLVRPAFDGADLSLASGLFYGGVRVPAGGAWSVVGEFPYARFGVGDQTGTVLGNLYAGVDYAPAGPSGVTFDLGARLPTSNESGDFFGGDATFAAVYADFDRAEAWLDEQWAAQGHAGYRHALGRGFEVGFTVGVSFWGRQDEDEALADYRVRADYREGGGAFGVEFTGRAFLTESGSYGERSIHQLAVGVGLATGPLWPRLSLRLPLDAALKDVGLKQSIGFGVDWRF